MDSIQTEELLKFFCTNYAIDGLSLESDKENFGLLGPNGSGKTTTVLMLTALLSQTKGRASICGYDTSKEPKKVKRCIGYIPQDFAAIMKLFARQVF